MTQDSFYDRVLFWFKQLCAIPHGSGDTKRISDFCVDFAKKHDLSCSQDAQNNVLIFKSASEGYEEHPTVILQGHLDMVCEKEPESPIDFSKDGLMLKTDGDFLYAEGTTLGGDDGIAVAYALAILESKEIKHPPLEVVFTVDEEIGMLGAEAIDLSSLKGRILMNLDSEEEGVLLVSCAGGVRQDLRLPVERTAGVGVRCEITVDGLIGGHSGTEIDKGRGNADKLLGKVLAEMVGKNSVRILHLGGGLKDNAIVRSAKAELLLDETDIRRLEASVRMVQERLSEEFKETDPDVRVSLKVCEHGGHEALTAESTQRVIALLNSVPNGVMQMDPQIKGFVQTSLNLGIMELSEKEFSLRFSLRSSVNEEKEAMIHRLGRLIADFGGDYTLMGNYPAWEYKKDSRLRDVMVEAYEKLYGEKPQVMGIHAGLECGLFSGKLPGLDCVSFGPNIYDIHTTRERISLSSVKRTGEYVLEVLKAL